MIWGEAALLSCGGWTMIADGDLLLTIHILQTAEYYGMCEAVGTAMAVSRILKRFRICVWQRTRRELPTVGCLTQ